MVISLLLINVIVLVFMTWFMCPYRKEGRKLWSNKGLVVLFYIIAAICAINIGMALAVLNK